MNKSNTWIDEILPLDRPEYAKQPEALLTDLLWRSAGSRLSREIKLSRRSDLVRLVPRLVHRNKPGDIVETMPVAEKTDVEALISNPGELPTPVKALLNSILAPRSRGDKSHACVPIHPDIVVLQTLQGLVNKAGPPDLARIIETVGWLGGSDGEGHVAWLLLQVMNQPASAREGLTGLVDRLLPEIAGYTWDELTSKHPQNPGIPTNWPKVEPGEIQAIGASILASHHPSTPFRWFWHKWCALCSLDNGWYGALPTRRFIDWATCLLRTGLSFAYLWEASFFTKLHACLFEELSARENPASSRTQAMASLQSMLKNGAILATIETPRVPATQKHAWNALSNLLDKGYGVRRHFRDFLSDNPFAVPPSGVDVGTMVQEWIQSLSKDDLENLLNPLQVDSSNLQEFVRYLLRPRSSDDDKSDQADFYYLLRTNSRRLAWFQPGPEWLVVVTSLLGERPGGRCTLGMLLDDLWMLGIRVERRLVVNMLEEAGLSTDSPDADNALVIRAGF